MFKAVLQEAAALASLALFVGHDRDLVAGAGKFVSAVWVSRIRVVMAGRRCVKRRA